jgi:hypothetical protein
MISEGLWVLTVTKQFGARVYLEFLRRNPMRAILFHLVLAGMLLSSGAAVAKQTDEQKRRRLAKWQRKR